MKNLSYLLISYLHDLIIAKALQNPYPGYSISGFPVETIKQLRRE